MKTVREAAKNMCKTGPLLRAFGHIRIAAAKRRDFSGFSPRAPDKIQPKIAVNMAEFPQEESEPQ
jgi:hypothetical protein